MTEALPLARCPWPLGLKARFGGSTPPVKRWVLGISAGFFSFFEYLAQMMFELGISAGFFSFFLMVFFAFFLGISVGFTIGRCTTPSTTRVTSASTATATCPPEPETPDEVSLAGDCGDALEEIRVVYMATHSKVFHLRPTCSWLSRSTCIQSIPVCKNCADRAAKRD